MTRGGTARTGLLAPLSAAVRQGRIPALRLIEESICRIDGASELNAVIARRDDEARRDAREMDAAIRAGSDPGPLAGLPLLVKDIEDVAGMTTTFGSALLVGAPPATADGMAVAALRGAGAIVVGKTNVPEFAFEGFTDNCPFGATRNPWQLAASPGGSSGGSGAALAAGLAPLATATDVGGSARIPASLCGLVGLKPTAALMAEDESLASAPFNSHGPLAAMVADARLLLDVLVASSPGVRAESPDTSDPRPRRLTILDRWVRDAGPLPPSVSTVFRTAVAEFAAVLGLDPEPVDQRAVFPSGYDLGDWYRIVGYEQARALGADLIAERGADFRPAFVVDMRDALAMTDDEHDEALARTERYRAELDSFLGRDTILVTPTLPADGWTADGRVTPTSRVGLPPEVFNTEPANLTGHPAISLPAGFLSSGIPFGVQLIGPRFSDWLLLDIAGAWERAAPWPLTAPGYQPFSIERVGAGGG